MNCPNCGTQVNATDSYCSFCGARVQHELQAQQHQSPASGYENRRREAANREDDTSKKNVKALLFSILGIVVAIILATLIFNYINDKNEESLWEQCESKHQIGELKEYIEKYPDGEHYEEAQALLNKLVRDKEAWDQARVSNDEDHLRAYIRNHPDSEHIDEAHNVLDDVVWNNAVAKNSKEAYDQYLRDFPDGKHAAEARSRFDERRRAELTTAESDNVRSTVMNFLLGLEEWNENLMLTTCNAEMTNFMGKSHATLSDVMEYYNAFRESDIDSIGFSATNVEVKKVIRSDRRAEYNVSFTTLRRMRRDNSDGEIVAPMKGRAVLDDSFRFNELTMDKVSQ